MNPESCYGSYTPTKSELSAIRKGRAEIQRGEFVTFDKVLHGMDAPHRKASRKGARKNTRQE
jgi:hypothetical protein